MITKEDVDNYQKLQSELFNYEFKINKAIRLFFEQKLREGDWQSYSGWSLNGNTLVISYSYIDYYCNTDTYTEYDDIKVDLNDFLEFGKTL